MPEVIAAAIQHTGKLGMLWCEMMHDSTTWPIHREYRCRTCGRHYPVPWAVEQITPIEIQARLPRMEQ